MVGIKYQTDEITKNALCQEILAFGKLIAVDNSDLERGDNIVRISLVFGSSSNSRFRA